MAANKTKCSNANKSAQGYEKYMSCQQYKSISMHYYPLSTPSFAAIPPNATNTKQRKIQPINIDFNNEKLTKKSTKMQTKQVNFYAIKQKERSNVRINKQGLNPVTSHALPFPLGKQTKIRVCERRTHATIYRCTQVVVSYTLVRCPVKKGLLFSPKAQNTHALTGK